MQKVRISHPPSDNSRFSEPEPLRHDISVTRLPYVGAIYTCGVRIRRIRVQNHGIRKVHPILSVKSWLQTVSVAFILVTMELICRIQSANRAEPDGSAGISSELSFIQTITSETAHQASFACSRGRDWQGGAAPATTNAQGSSWSPMKPYAFSDLVLRKLPEARSGLRRCAPCACRRVWGMDISSFPPFKVYICHQFVNASV